LTFNYGNIDVYGNIKLADGSLPSSYNQSYLYFKEANSIRLSANSSLAAAYI
jgi:hypothetical protein